jgi:hypothetical protein
MNRPPRRPVKAALVSVVVVGLAALAHPGLGWAQTFEKFNESARDQLPASPFVAGAYAFIWLALLTYVLVLARGLRSAQNDIQSLKRRVQERTGVELPRADRA